MNKVFLENCKEAIADVENNKLPDLLTSFDKRQASAQKKGDKDLQTSMQLLWGIFSMFLQFSKGQPYGPYFVIDGKRSLMPDDLTENDLTILEELVQEISYAQFVARICDVLWIRRKKYPFAQRAVNAYAQSIDEDKDDCWVPRGHWLKRATQIAMELGEKAPEREFIRAKLHKLFEQNREKCFSPGMDHYPSAILKLILENKLADNWSELGDMTVAIAKGFPLSPGCDGPRNYYDLAAKCYQNAGDLKKAKECDLAIANHWEAEARSFKTPQGCDGLNLAHRLDKAIHAYRKVGEKEKAEKLIQELKEANKAAVDQMKPIEIEMDITPLIKLADSLQGKVGMDLIEGFVSLYRPSSFESMKSLVEKLAEKHPLQAIIGKSIITSEGNVSAKTPGILEDNVEGIEAEIINQYNISQNIVAAALRRAITNIQKTDGTWKEAIKQIIEDSAFVPKGRQGIFEKAIIAGFECDWMALTHLIIPQIENSLRLIFSSNGLKITKVFQTGIQEERDLNDLLIDKDVEKIFDKDLIWEMRSLLTEKSGSNLRNRVCHGLMSTEEINSASSLFLLWLVLYLIVGFLPKK
jgi:tetratricopeptide (TPR) repeat protein